MLFFINSPLLLSAFNDYVLLLLFEDEAIGPLFVLLALNVASISFTFNIVFVGVWYDSPRGDSSYRPGGFCLTTGLILLFTFRHVRQCNICP